MQTQSDKVTGDEWRVTSKNKARSVFSNFKTSSAEAATRDAETVSLSPPRGEGQGEGSETLQAAIDNAVARAFIYRFLAKAFEDPGDEGWSALTDASAQAALLLTAKRVSKEVDLKRRADNLVAHLNSAKLNDFKSEYVAAFGHAARGRCPLNEIEYGDIKADPLFQPHRLADLAAFYSAFGLEITNDAAERQDHVCLELEFMSVLAAKEAYALEHQLDSEQLALCRDAQKLFLREHLGRWTPAFTRRLSKMVGEESPLGALADFTREFVAAECARFDITPGSEDLLLRPVHLADESLCDSCGIASRLPGALQTCGET